MKLIVAVSENNVIGRQGEIPWHVPADLQWFKLFTTSKTIAMGKNTFKSVGLLPGRTTLILDRSTKLYELPKDTVIVGGGVIYKEAVQYCEQLLVSRIPLTVEDGDTFFEVPENFTCTATIDFYSFKLEVYTRDDVLAEEGN